MTQEIKPSEAAQAKTVTLNEQQASIVQQALDAAIRAGGANAAVQILPLMQDIERQLVVQRENN